MRNEKSVTAGEKIFAPVQLTGQSSERLSICILAMKCNMQCEASCPRPFIL